MLYADDIKLYRFMRGPDDADALKDSLNVVLDWCRRNKMSLNASKCEVISFSRRRADRIHNFQYNLDGQLLKRVEVVKDLGVLLDSKMTLKPQVDHVIARAKSTLGFVKRHAREFNCPYVTRSLYCSLVRPLLEYASIVWAPLFDCDRDRIESVQKQFLLFALRHLEWSPGFELPPYEARLTLLNLDTLEERRRLAACSFVFNCLNNDVKASVAGSFQPAAVLRETRSSTRCRLRQPRFATSRYIENGPVRRCIAIFNTLCSSYGMATSLYALKTDIRKQFMENRRTSVVSSSR